MTLTDFYAHARACNLRLYYGCVRDECGRCPIVAVTRRVTGHDYGKEYNHSAPSLGVSIGLTPDDAHEIILAADGCKWGRFAAVREALLDLSQSL